MVFWLIPLATIIFSPGALTFGDYLDTRDVTRGVPHINFTTETTKDWRHPVLYDPVDDELTAPGGYKRSVMYYNTTDKSQDPTTPGWFDYYDQPSAELKRIANLFGFNLMNHSTHRLGARQYVCGKPEAGGPYNCTFTQDFIAPAYKCDLVADGIGDNSRLADLGAPFNTTSLVPEGHNVYQAEVGLGDYKHPQMESFQKGPGGIPVGDVPADLGVFKAEPLLWIGYSINSTERLPSDSPFNKSWTHRYDPRIIRCVMHEAKYTVKWNFSGPYFMEMTTLDFLFPVIDTNFTRNADGTPNYAADPEPASNFIRPQDVALYKKTAAYHATGDVLRAFLGGTIELEPPLPGPSYPVVSSPVTQTRLVGVDSLPKRLQPGPRNLLRRPDPLALLRARNARRRHAPRLPHAHPVAILIRLRPAAPVDVLRARDPRHAADPALRPGDRARRRHDLLDGLLAHPGHDAQSHARRYQPRRVFGERSVSCGAYAYEA